VISLCNSQYNFKLAVFVGLEVCTHFVLSIKASDLHGAKHTCLFFV
jgi:hypothetical protein